jgi:hypothetical protein
VPIFRTYNGQVSVLPRKKLSQSVKNFYDVSLSNYNSNDYGEVELYGDETIQLVSQRLCEACQRKGVGIEIISENRGVLFFKIIENQQLELNL